MKDFVAYTLARLAVFIGTFAALWVVASWFFETDRIMTLSVLLVSLIVSSIISIVLLSGMRDKLAVRIQHRAEALHDRIEESRRAEDVD